MNINKFGIGEMRWIGTGKIKSDDYTVIFAGGQKHDKEAGMILYSKTSKATMFLEYIRQYNTSLAERKEINIKQVNVPTTDGSEEDLQEVYNQMEHAVK